jgi:hypothetical protein
MKQRARAMTFRIRVPRSGIRAYRVNRTICGGVSAYPRTQEDSFAFSRHPLQGCSAGDRHHVG